MTPTADIWQQQWRRLSQMVQVIRRSQPRLGLRLWHVTELAALQNPGRLVIDAAPLPGPVILVPP